MSYVIHVTHCYSRGTINTPRDGILRDAETGAFIAYLTREAAEAWVAVEDSGIYYLSHGEMGRPHYCVRKAHPNMRTIAIEKMRW